MAQPGLLRVDGFDYTTIGVGRSSYTVGIAGDGPPVLLLHGFPQNQYCWHRVAPALRRDHTVVLCDLKGCGESRAPRGGLLGEGYSKREMAAELVQVMADSGFGRFSVVGHDRGGRVAYRMALDSPASVTASVRSTSSPPSTSSSGWPPTPPSTTTPGFSSRSHRPSPSGS